MENLPATTTSAVNSGLPLGPFPTARHQQAFPYIQNQHQKQRIQIGSTSCCVAPFLANLLHILGNEDPEIISWTENGSAFEIHDYKRFISDVLPKYFRHKRFSSFQRQLNYFGFRKTSKAAATKCTYVRQYFVRDKPEDIQHICRNKKKRQKNASTSKSGQIGAYTGKTIKFQTTDNPRAQKRRKVKEPNEGQWPINSANSVEKKQEQGCNDDKCSSSTSYQQQLLLNNQPHMPASLFEPRLERDDVEDDELSEAVLSEILESTASDEDDECGSQSTFLLQNMLSEQLPLESGTDSGSQEGLHKNFIRSDAELLGTTSPTCIADANDIYPRPTAAAPMQEIMGKSPSAKENDCLASMKQSTKFSPGLGNYRTLPPLVALGGAVPEKQGQADEKASSNSSSKSTSYPDDETMMSELWNAVATLASPHSSLPSSARTAWTTSLPPLMSNEDALVSASFYSLFPRQQITPRMTATSLETAWNPKTLDDYLFSLFGPVKEERGPQSTVSSAKSSQLRLASDATNTFMAEPMKNAAPPQRVVCSPSSTIEELLLEAGGSTVFKRAAAEPV